MFDPEQIKYRSFKIGFFFESENTDSVRELLKQDCRVTHHEIDAFLDISMKRINKILQELLAGKNGLFALDQA